MRAREARPAARTALTLSIFETKGPKWPAGVVMTKKTIRTVKALDRNLKIWVEDLTALIADEDEHVQESPIWPVVGALQAARTMIDLCVINPTRSAPAVAVDGDK